MTHADRKQISELVAQMPRKLAGEPLEFPWCIAMYTVVTTVDVSQLDDGKHPAELWPKAAVMSTYGATEDQWKTLIEEEAFIAGAGFIVQADAAKMASDQLKHKIDAFMESSHELSEEYQLVRCHVNRSLNPCQSDVDEVHQSLKFIEEKWSPTPFWPRFRAGRFAPR